MPPIDDNSVTLQDVYYRLGQMEASLQAALRRFEDQKLFNDNQVAKIDHLMAKIEGIEIKIGWLSGAAAIISALVSYLVSYFLRKN